MGLTYVEAIHRRGRSLPVQETATTGKVRDAGHLLVDDLKWCWIGEQDADKTFCDMAQGRTHHVVELSLTRPRKAGR